MVALSKLMPRRTKLESGVDALEDSKATLQAVSRSMAMIEFDLDGTILHANENFLKAMGYQESQIVGQHHSLFVDREYGQSREYREFWDTLNRGEFLVAEFRRIKSNGEEIWLQACYNPVLNSQGRPYKVIKFAADITPMVKVRIQREKERENLLESLRTSMSEMTTTIQEISSNVNSTACLTEESVASVRQTSSTVATLSESSQSIGQVVDVIRRLADQTNLLALNATIESARAGEAGQGFAVVANEVKNLARQTSDATANIEASINDIQAAVEDVVSSTAEVDEHISTVNGNMSAIASAVEEQSVTMNALDEQTSCMG